MATNRTPPGTDSSPPVHGAGKPERLLVGMEPDPVTRRLVELYLEPLGYVLRWVDSLVDWPGVNSGAIAFLLSANALPTLNEAAVAQIADRAGAIPLLGMAGDRHRFPPQTVPNPVRQILRKPIRADALMSALEALQTPPQMNESTSPLDGFTAMIEEMGMDAEMTVDLCRSFIERGERYLLEAMSAAGPRDNERLDRIAHAFKGMAGNMRLRRMAELSEALRRAAKEQTGDVIALTRNMQVEFGALRELLQAQWLKHP